MCVALHVNLIFLPPLRTAAPLPRLQPATRGLSPCKLEDFVSLYLKSVIKVTLTVTITVLVWRDKKVNVFSLLRCHQVAFRNLSFHIYYIPRTIIYYQRVGYFLCQPFAGQSKNKPTWNSHNVRYRLSLQNINLSQLRAQDGETNKKTTTVMLTVILFRYHQC